MARRRRRSFRGKRRGGRSRRMVTMPRGGIRL